MAGNAPPRQNDRLVALTKRWIRRSGTTIGPFSPAELVACSLRSDDDVSPWELGSWTKASDDPLTRIFADADPRDHTAIDHWRAYSPRNTHTVIEFSGNPAGIAFLIETYHQVLGSDSGGRLIVGADGTFILDEMNLNGEQVREFCEAMRVRFDHPKIYQFSQEVYGEPIVIATRLQSSAKNRGGALRIADSTFDQLAPGVQKRFQLVPGQPIAPDYPETRGYECRS